MVVHTTRSPGPDAAVRFTELVDGYLGTRLLYVAAELDLMDALLAAPAPCARKRVPEHSFPLTT